jgi:hypothetical protein
MFVVASASFRLLYVMIILTHDHRKIVRFDVTRHPTAGWLARQVTEAFPWDTAPRYLLRDRDASYGENFRKQVDTHRLGNERSARARLIESAAKNLRAFLDGRPVNVVN